MLSPSGLDIIRSRLTCELRADRSFCDLDIAALKAFENIKFVATYPRGPVLFVEGQTPRASTCCARCSA